MSDRVEFKPPKGVVPEDVQAGDTFDLVSTYRVKDNGEICLVQIGDTKMEGYDEDEYKEKSQKTRQDYGEVMSAMHTAMSEGGTDPGSGGGY